MSDWTESLGRWWAAASRSETTGVATRTWAALFALVLALFANQYVTLRRAKSYLLSQTEGESMSDMMDAAPRLLVENWREFLGPADFAIGGALVLVLLGLVHAERTEGALSALLRRAERSHRVLCALLALFALGATRYYLNPGDVFMGDTETHTIRSWMVAEQLKRFELPVWTNYWYGGFPLLQYYAPLYLIVTALLTIAFGDVQTATKVLLWVTHTGSIFAMFFFLRKAVGRALPALVGAVAYGLAFHRVHIVLYRGDLQLSIVFLLYPVIFFLVERLLHSQGRERRTFLLLTFALVALIINHQGYGFFGLVFLCVYVLVRVATRWKGAAVELRRLAYFGLAVTSALLISVFALVPFVFGMDVVRGMPNMVFGFLLPNARAPVLLSAIFRWAPIGRVENFGYMGISIGLCALLGAGYAFRRRASVPIGLATSMIASLLMSKNFAQYNVKNLNFFLFFLSALAAWALVALEDAERPAFLARMRQRLGERFGARAALLLIGLILVDLGPTTFHSVYREHYDFKEVMYARLSARDGDYKVVEHQRLKYEPGADPRRHFDPFKLGNVAAFSKVACPTGWFHEAAGRSFGYNVEMVKNLHRDLLDDRISERSLEGLYLMGVKYVLFRDRFRYFSPPLAPSADYVLEDDVLELEHASPLILATEVLPVSRIEGYPVDNVIERRQYFDPETYDYSGTYFRDLVVPILDAMGVDRSRGVARTLVAAEGTEAKRASTSSEALAVEIGEVSVDFKSVVVRYRSTGDAFGQLAYTHFPYLVVEVDGKPVDFWRSAMSYIQLPLPAGEHVVTVRGVASPLRVRSSWFSLLALAGVVALPRRFHRFFAPSPEDSA